MAKLRCLRYPLMKALLTQHELKSAHQAAPNGVRYQASSAPSSDHFMKVLEAVRTVRHRQPIEGVAGKHNIAKMRWCLAEAARSLDRRLLNTARSVTLLQDARTGNLLVRFKEHAQLVTRRGVLGVVKVDGDAYALRDATLQV